MERLTIDAYDVIGSYVPKEMCSIGRDGMVDDFDGCPDYCFDSVDSSCEECAIQKCFNLLGEYEDTGLTPEQILEMDGMYKELSREVMAYRKAGTVEELRKLETRELRDLELAQIAIAVQKSREYEAIGTVEECREAVERQKAKKPLRIDMCTCPTCGTYNESVKKRRNTVNQDIVYCWHCGQAMEINRSDEGD